MNLLLDEPKEAAGLPVSTVSGIGRDAFLRMAGLHPAGGLIFKIQKSDANIWQDQSLAHAGAKKQPIRLRPDRADGIAG